MTQRLSKWNLVAWIGLIVFHLLMIAMVTVAGHYQDASSEEALGASDPYLIKQPKSNASGSRVILRIFPCVW